MYNYTMKVALVMPPLGRHAARGIGFYSDRLFKALSSKIRVEQIKFSLIAPSGFDIVHYPFFDLFWPTFPPVRFTKTIVTLHDLTPLKFPQHFPLGRRAKIVWPWQRLLLRQVDAVLTDSYCSKNDITEIVGSEIANKVYVTHLAADPVFKPLNLKREEFVLYVGGANWNKNVLSLAKACQKIKMPLVLVGKEFTSTPIQHIENESLIEILKQVQNDKNISIRGFVETNELVKLYNLAKVYVQPSIYEGFGLPVLEAMACGTPVICGNNSSIAEIAGDAATFADVTNADMLATAITDIKPTGSEVDQAKKFTWEKTAEETIKVYEKVLGKV